ncbi:MAG: hypothetical protein GXO00_00620 [Candidatus Diapherotrites archaeon]|nr:hypothetical protein [Candidatus Diapherotrites archaeon]
MKSLPATFRLKRVDKEIAEMVKEGVELKRIARRTKLPFKVVVKKVEKLRKLGVVS